MPSRLRLKSLRTVRGQAIFAEFPTYDDHDAGLTVGRASLGTRRESSFPNEEQTNVARLAVREFRHAGRQRESTVLQLTFPA